MNRWRRYPRIIAICWRAALAAELQYRLQFAAGALLSLFWLGWAAAGASVYFRFTGDVAGWRYGEVLVVIGLFFAVNGLRQAVFEPNLRRMDEYVRRGTLDVLLTKPVRAQALVGLRHLDVANLLDPLLGAGLVAAGLAVAGRGVGPAEAAGAALTLAAAVVLLYALNVALMALSVRLLAAPELGEVAFTAVELARFPVALYREPVRTLLTVVPVAFLTTVPAQALLGRADGRLLAAAPAVAAVALVAANLAWRRALRGYTGAGS